MTPYELDVRETDREDVTLVELSGELDLTNASEVERRLIETAATRPGLVLDLNRVDFADSAALHMLFRVASRYDEKPRLGIVFESDALVARTLAIVGIDEVANVGSSFDALMAQSTS